MFSNTEAVSEEHALTDDLPFRVITGGALHGCSVGAEKLVSSPGG